MALRPPLGDLYGELGVAPDATREQIAAAYRARAKELHPDTRPVDADAASRFARVGVAYRVLSSPTERARYDESLTGELRPAPAAPTAPTGRTAPASPTRRHRLSLKGARWCAWGGAVSIVLGIALGVFVVSLQVHDANLRAHGIATTAVVIPGTAQRQLEFQTRDGTVVRATETVRSGEEQPALGTKVRIHYDPKHPTTVVTDVSHTGRDITLWIVTVKLVIGGAVLMWFGVRRLRRGVVG